MRVEDIFCDLPTLGTKRLLLRKLSLSDTADVFEYNSDPEVSKYMTWQAHRSPEETREFIETIIRRYCKGQVAPWGIELRENTKLIGSCGFTAWDTDHARGEVGFVLSPNYSGRGYMTEALREVISFGFRRMALNRIEARCMIHNRASARLLERVGMMREGVLRQQICIRGIYYDMEMYSILRQEYIF